MIASEPTRIPAADGYSLAATVFHPPAPGAASRVVVVASAMGVRQPFYYPSAEYLAERGAAVVCFDYRGIGGSRPGGLRGFPARLADWGKLDLAGVVAWSRNAFPGRRVAVLAHSVGGQILGLAARDGAVDSVLAVAAQSGYWGHWSGAGRLRVIFLWYVLIPTLTRVLGYFPSRWFRIGEDLPVGVAREWAYWGRHPRYLRGRLSADDLRGFDSYRGRYRALGIVGDPFAPEKAVRALLDFYPNAEADVRMIGLENTGGIPPGHFGFFRECVGERVWPAELSWLLSPGTGGT